MESVGRNVVELKRDDSSFVLRVGSLTISIRMDGSVLIKLLEDVQVWSSKSITLDNLEGKVLLFFKGLSWPAFGNRGQNVWTANFYNAVLMDNDHNNYNQNRFLQMFMVKLLSIIKTEQSIIFSIPPTFWPWRSMLMRNSRGNDKFVTLTNPRGNANLKIVKL